MIERIVIASRETWLAQLGQASGLESMHLADRLLESLPAFAQVEIIATLATMGVHITDADLNGRFTIGDLYERALSYAIEIQMPDSYGTE